MKMRERERERESVLSKIVAQCFKEKKREFEWHLAKREEEFVFFCSLMIYMYI